MLYVSFCNLILKRAKVNMEIKFKKRVEEKEERDGPKSIREGGGNVRDGTKEMK